MVAAYLRIHEELRRRIQNGEYTADASLPSQRRLSEEFGVTLMTLRQAVDLLKREGLLVTKHGLGTFVAPRRFSYSIGPLRSLAQEMAAQGLAVRTKVLRLEEVAPEPWLAAELALPPNGRAVLLERLRIVDGVPAVYQRSFLPAPVGRAFVADELERSSLYDLMGERLGIEVHHARERLYPTVLDAQMARLLERAKGEPALLSERLTVTATERPVLHDQAFMPGDRLVVATERHRNDVSIRYELLDREAAHSKRRGG
jgi:GntR family transcriptional regulator